MSKNEYNGTYADIYVLSENRSEKFIFDFLDYFIPERNQRADEYEFPQYGEEQELIFKTDSQIIKFLVQNYNLVYSLYWSNTKNEDLKGAMIFFTSDSKIIAGLYCNTLENITKIEDNYFDKLISYTQSEYGYITYEQIPEMDTTKFIEISKIKD